MTTKRYKNVWDAIGEDPVAAENLKIRASLMRKLACYLDASGTTQSKAAQRLGVTQPKVSDLTRGMNDLFSIDSLINMLSAVGMHVDVRVNKAS
ncbi:MAG TPA: XRE family transcriptional regulator [Mycobacterium sp.]|nr:XRE family transcriptional regulator [Mycobacterium sp.]